MNETVVADIEPHMRSAFTLLIEEQQVPGSQVFGRQPTRMPPLPTGRPRDPSAGACVTVMH
jgi:hypothetical protein